MKKSIKTRTRYKIIGSDYSAQEPRLTAHLSESMIQVNEGESFAKKKPMIQAYLDGKDLYCVIATGMFNNNYEDNLEFYQAGTELEIDGKKVIAGDGASPYTAQVEDSTELFGYNILELDTKEDCQVAFLQPGMKLSNGLVIKSIEKNDKKYLLTFM